MDLAVGYSYVVILTMVLLIIIDFCCRICWKERTSPLSGDLGGI